MTVDSSFISYFFHASIIVKLVMITLLAASFYSWYLIFQRGFFIRFIRNDLNIFEKRFWSTHDIGELYNQLAAKKECDGIEKIFCVGFKEYARLRKREELSANDVIEGVQRAMRVTQAHFTDDLDDHLSFLATIGSTSPYIGLFGTVWGIMTAFQALGFVQQATISMVAPGISEALIATAMGLFAAIPAVISYNRYSNSVDRILNRYEAFQDAFLSYLFRQQKS